jgi:hypothetical protein
VRSHAKASSAGSSTPQAAGLWRIVRGVVAPRAFSHGANASGAPARRLLLALSLSLLLAALFAASASAAPVTIAESGTGAGKVEGPQGTDVKQSNGDLYVADEPNHRIDKFDSAGHFLLAWGYGVADGTSEVLQTCGPEASPPTARCFSGTNFFEAMFPRDVAVDQASGDVYVADSVRRRVLKFTSSGQLIFMVGQNVNKTKEAEAGATQAEKDFCAAASGDTCGVGESGAGPNEFANPLALAVKDSGPNAGRVWVGDTDRLMAIEPDGTPGPEVGLPGEGDTVALAVDSAGNFYTVRPGTIERQSISFEGIGNGVTFALGNLPLSCSSSEIGPIPLYAQDPSFPQKKLEEILEENCGDSVLYGSTYFYFVNQMADQNVGQLSCTILSGGGSCSVTTERDGAPGTVEKLDPSGALLDTLYTGGPEALTRDAAGNLYIGDRRGKYHFVVLDPAGQTTSVFAAGQVKANAFTGLGPQGNALALDEGSGTLYAANGLQERLGAVQAFTLPEPGPLPENQHVSDLEPTTVTLAADLNPEGSETTYHFEYGTSQSYGESTPIEMLAGEEFDPEPVEAELEGLTPNTPYHFRLCATNADATVCGPDTSFTTLPAVAIDPQWVTDVTATTAELHAEMDPIGVEAEAWLEYGTSESYGQVVPLANLGAGFGAVARQVFLEDLQPGTTYHYRFAARDERDGVIYTVHGEDRVFATQVSGLGFELPDNRAWEMVSPSNKHGGQLLMSQEGHLQASADGEGLAYQSAGSFEEAPEGNRILEASMNLALRGAGGTWRFKDITSPNASSAPLPLGAGTEYKIFSPDLGSALLEPRSVTPLSPAASERAPYLRVNTEPPSYTPLVTDKEGYANIPPGTGFGGDDQVGRAIGYVRVQGATPTLEHVVLKSDISLGPGTAAENGLYEWFEGQLERVSVLPEDEGGEMTGSLLGSGPGSVRNAISHTGSRVFWTSDGGSRHLYLHEAGTTESVKLDRLQPSASGEGSANPVFQGASADGTVVFFTDTHQLTAGASPKGSDLYRCEIPEGAAPGGCATLTDISAPTSGSAESAEVLGIAAALSADGSRIYFVAKGALDGAPNRQGDSAVAGEPNLYLWQQGEGVRFVATLSADDMFNWGNDVDPSAAKDVRLSTSGSPSGRYLAFMSRRSLTGFENRNAASDEPVQEVFRYDASADSLECASCNPTGARPLSIEPTESAARFVNAGGAWPGQQVAATLPQAVGIGGGNSIYRPRSVLDNGRVFFNAIDALVPADSNGEWDVYQYESDGVGDCTASSGGAATSRMAGGCVSLLSSGTGEGESAFYDASESGDDAFFLTGAALSVNDEDRELDIYDARVNGIPATRTPVAECSGEACQPVAQAPDDPTPASAAFKGAGNVRPEAAKRCAKGKQRVRRKGRVRCVAKKHHHQRTKRPAGRKRRASR